MVLASKLFLDFLLTLLTVQYKRLGDDRCSPSIANRYDFIIVGGGTAGAIVASRLAASRAQPSVLLIESGGSSSSFSDIPFISTLLPYTVLSR